MKENEGIRSSKLSIYPLTVPLEEKKVVELSEKCITERGEYLVAEIIISPSCVMLTMGA